MRALRQRFWLFVLDVICLVRGGFGSRAYYWALQRASNATDWGPALEPGEHEGEEPF